MLNFVGMQKRLPFAPFQLVFPGGNPLTQFGAQPPDQFVSRANSPEGIKSMLESTITEDNILGTGLDATVYRRPDSSGKVLRAVKGFQSRLPKDLSQMKIIPVYHPSVVADNPRIFLQTHAILLRWTPACKGGEASTRTSYGFQPQNE